MTGCHYPHSCSAQKVSRGFQKMAAFKLKALGDLSSRKLMENLDSQSQILGVGMRQS